MQNQDLIELTKELVNGLFSVQVACIEWNQSSFQSHYKQQLPPFLTTQQKDKMAERITTLPPNLSVGHYKDSLSMNYVTFSCDQDQLVVLGPYKVQRVSQETVQDSQSLPSHSLPIYTYLETIPICQTTDLIFFAQTIIRKVAKTETDYPVVYYHLENIMDIPKDDRQQDEIESLIPLLEQRYDLNNRLLLEVQYGNVVKAKQHFQLLREQLKVIKRNKSPIRNKKNLAFVFNTLLRLSVEQASVHPYYIDKISSHFATRIESSTSVQAIEELEFKMVDDYCRLVQQYSLKDYAPIIRKVINYIQIHLSDELTLEQLAEYANVSTSHLSRLFNKEVHESIPNYINRLRAIKAAELLQFSQQPIQEVGEYVGFYDINYFTKIFKKYYHVPPVQYRKEHSYQ
ncbi:AraC family transcriptional regulator [Aquibacillus sediminis]|uniref:AraC family transcriptional regulator n=1 Tax=Aquibacillus sediminis TaxID=2574734 RepID=UPI00110995D9|nr:AraC family transcriptional regulator [Aquibacillus sediminis]